MLPTIQVKLLFRLLNEGFAGATANAMKAGVQRPSTAENALTTPVQFTKLSLQAPSSKCKKLKRKNKPRTVQLGGLCITYKQADVQKSPNVLPLSFQSVWHRYKVSARDSLDREPSQHNSNKPAELFRACGFAPAHTCAWGTRIWMGILSNSDLCFHFDFCFPFLSELCKTQ